MYQITNLDRFLIYVILPFLAILPLLGTKLYFNTKDAYYQQFQAEKKRSILTLNLIIGNIGAGIAINILTLILYLYILNINLMSEIRWELLTICIISLFSYIIGLGFGSHITAITVKTALRPGTISANKRLEKILNYFHYPFSHKYVYAGVIMNLYVLSLLDLFKGKALPLSTFQTLLSISAGICAGGVAALLFIITKSQTFTLKVSIIFTISLYFVLLNESRTVWAHPIALMITTVFLTLIIAITLQKQSKLNLRSPAKKMVKKWLSWDIDQI